MKENFDFHNLRTFKLLKTSLFSIFFTTLLGSCKSPKNTSPTLLDPYQYSADKMVVAKRGAVVSAHALASDAGLLMLRKGGNAIDAAIATQLALAVVYPGAGNLGGGGFLVATLADGKKIAIDFREKAPLAAHTNMYLDKEGNPIPGLSLSGHLASGVPGAVAGIYAAHRYARLPMSELIRPAIILAEKGFAITESEATSLNEARAEFIQINPAAFPFVKPEPWKTGDTLIQKDLAATLARIRDSGEAGFYRGTTANLIVAEMQRGKGMITHQDLVGYKAVERDPVLFTYKNYEIVTMPLPSSGGVLLPQMMKMAAKFNLPQFGFHSWRSVQLMIEIERRVYADRAQYLGDIDFIKVPVEKLTSDEYLVERMKDYDSSRPTPNNDLPVRLIPESEETTHLNAYDSEGNAVAITTTLNDSYGSKTIVQGAGFILNNEMDDFSIKPGVRNMYGALGGKANEIAPGKRMLSSMTPTIVLKNKKPYLIVGTPGGLTIPTSVFQTLINILEFGMNTEDAVNKPKFHFQWQPDSISIEPGFPLSVVRELEKRGYHFDSRGPIGRTEVIKVLSDGRIEAVADIRGDDDAAGY
jgi:gamma-glutamyltranspeptidase / glutathione hydrolase